MSRGVQLDEVFRSLVSLINGWRQAGWLDPAGRLPIVTFTACSSRLAAIFNEDAAAKNNRQIYREVTITFKLSKLIG